MKYFKGLDTIQKIELTLLTLLVMAVPLYWMVASYVLVVLFVFGLAKLIFVQKFKLNKQQTRHTFAYLIFAATWVMYFIGLFYSSDTAAAWEQIGKKLYFLIFPLYFLFSDLSFINKERLRYLLYVLTFSLIAVFIIELLRASYNIIFDEKTVRAFFSPNLSIFNKHHAYVSMYICLALAFLFVEIFTVESVRMKIVNIICSVILVINNFLENSRAGMLCMVILFLILVVWVMFVKGKKKVGLYVFLATGLLLVVSCFVFESSFNRLVDTFNKVTSENKVDTRTVIYESAGPVAREYCLFGAGTGDRIDVLRSGYRDYKEKILDNIKPIDAEIEDFDTLKVHCLDTISDMFSSYTFDSLTSEAVIIAEDYGCQPQTVESNVMRYKVANSLIKGEINSHNQYFDTLISIGIIGLILMLSYFIIPVILMIKKKEYDIVYLSFMFIILFNSIFESVFERQLGIIFFLLFHCLFFHVSFCQNNKSCSSLKNC